MPDMQKPLTGPEKATAERADIYRGWRTHVCPDGQAVVQISQVEGRLFPNLDRAHDWIDKQRALQYNKAANEAIQAEMLSGYSPPVE